MTLGKKEAKSEQLKSNSVSKIPPVRLESKSARDQKYPTRSQLRKRQILRSTWATNHKGGGASGLARGEQNVRPYKSLLSQKAPDLSADALQRLESTTGGPPPYSTSLCRSALTTALMSSSPPTSSCKAQHKLLWAATTTHSTGLRLEEAAQVCQLRRSVQGAHHAVRQQRGRHAYSTSITATTCA
eukprot:6376711-Amphidinium_carterae.2